MELVHTYRGAHAFVDGQPCKITDVVIVGPGKSGHMTGLCRVRNMMTDECSVNLCHRSYKLFNPEERVYRVTARTDEPPTLHLEDDLGALSVPVRDTRVDQWVWERLQQGPDNPATVTLLVMKNPAPREGEQRVFYRLTSAYVLGEVRQA